MKAASTLAKRPVMDFEGKEQTSLMRWLELQHPDAFKVTYHVPNGGKRDKATAGKLKAQGVKAGVPDLVVAQARGGHFGLYLEFKATPPHDAAVSSSQKEWVARLGLEGYRSLVCKGVAEAMGEINRYLALPRTQGGQVCQ